MSCTQIMHIFVDGDKLGSAPWCQCGRVRNQFYRRTWLQRLRGLPK